ncbi:MAG: membrane protein insertion efficiency factor YidD [Planctomycetota bacterium]
MNVLRSLGFSLIWCVVWTYRITLGWLLGGQCRFTPTCSQYMLDAARKHGPIRGGWMGLKRIARCHPLSRGGHDPA